MTADEGDVDRKIPVTLVTGFLGSGKTTFIQRLLKERHGMRIAVLQNELSHDMGIEKPVLSAGGASVFELANGCLCCSLKDGIVDAVESILQFRCKFDWLVVEAAGNVDPLELASNFWVDPASPLILDGVLSVACPAVLCDILFSSDPNNTTSIRLRGYNTDKCATVSNEASSNGTGSTAAPGSQRFNLLGKDALDGHDMRELMRKQLSIADVIIVNKMDDWDRYLSDIRLHQDSDCPSPGKHEINSVFSSEDFNNLLKQTNPTAKLLWTNFCSVDFDDVMNLKMFNASRIMSIPRDAGHTHHHHSMQSSVFLKSTGLYSLTYVNDFVSSLLWDSGATVYRCKGIFRAIRDCQMIASADGEEAIFQLQGVGMLFEINEVEVAELEDNRFLFIGPDLSADHINSGLKLPR
ncbi:CobW/P47K domain containing protein [Babesia divergens]|uniref:CobW/P47K domain containing protein n=1 Tax=Babesia divergens TaxID=32595 RepID=A0AAD9LEL3_BABDI|nr:CobW/P47K domain containing protein [Babesia divergens]